MKMENHEEILNALNDFEKKRGKIPPLLDQFLSQVARTGETLFPWPQLKPLLLTKLEQVMHQFNQEVPSEHLPLFPNVENVKFEEMCSRIMSSLEKFHGAPFTIQRLCELVTDPTKHYKHCDKFLRGIEKNVLVVSTVDPFGRKVVSESKNLVNGLDVNGHSLSKVEQAFSPLPSLPVSSVMTDYMKHSEPKEVVSYSSNNELKHDYDHGADGCVSEEEKANEDIRPDIDRLDQVPVVCEFSEAHKLNEDQMICDDLEKTSHDTRATCLEESLPVSKLQNTVPETTQETMDQDEAALPPKSDESSTKPEPIKKSSEPVPQSCESDHGLKEPVTQPSEPDHRSSESVTLSSESDQELSDSVAQSCEPVAQSCEPNHSVSESVTQPCEPDHRSSESVAKPCEPDLSLNESVTQPCELDQRLSESNTQPCEPDIALNESVAQSCEPDHRVSESVSQPCEPDLMLSESVAQPCELDHGSGDYLAHPCEPDVMLNESVAHPCELDQRSSESVAQPCKQDHTVSESIAQPCELDHKLSQPVAQSCELHYRATEVAQSCESDHVSSDLNLTTSESDEVKKKEETEIKQDGLGLGSEMVTAVSANNSPDICTQTQTVEQDFNNSGNRITDASKVVKNIGSSPSCESDDVSSSEQPTENSSIESASNSHKCEIDLNCPISDQEMNIENENQEIIANKKDSMEVSCDEQNEEKIPADRETSSIEEIFSSSSAKDCEQNVQPMEED